MGGGISYKDSSLRRIMYDDIYNVIVFLIQTIRNSKIIPFFCFTSLINQLQNTTQSLYFIDTKDFSTPLESLNTMNNVAKILNLDFKNSTNDFTANYSSINIYKHFFNFHFDIQSTQKEIIATKSIHHKFYTLKEFIQNGGIEEVLLEYFNNNTKVRNQIKLYWDYELSMIKENAPEKIKSWKHYNKFVESF